MCQKITELPGFDCGEHPANTIVWDQCRTFGADEMAFGEM